MRMAILSRFSGAAMTLSRTSSSSNPITSVGPILAVHDIRDALRCTRAEVIAISPLIGHAAFSGPAAKLMEAVGALSNDGKSFSVVVTREGGTQETHDLCYRDLLKVLSELG